MKNSELKKIIERIEDRPWKDPPYSKQNWGVWMHSVSSYVGRIKPAFAHFLIKEFSNIEDTILDPFCGIGTIPLECNMLERKFIGNDLNPYAYLISKAKFDRNGKDKEIKYLKKINLDKLKKPETNKIPDWVKEYYHQETLIEILKIRDLLIKDNKSFLLGCLLGIIHGHRPQHLSIRTGYIIPYIPKPKPKKEYREVIPRLVQKVIRMYTDDLPSSIKGKIICEDAKKLSIKNDAIDLVISSPPYYHTLDYVHSNRLRLWFSGMNDNHQLEIKEKLIQHRDTYIEEMNLVGAEIKRVLKPNGIVAFILGDVHLGKYKTLNTAKDISEIFSSLNFKTHKIIEDEIPADRTTIVKYGGDSSIKKKRRKLDRILIMSNE